jgi:hypothetical protein
MPPTPQAHANPQVLRLSSAATQVLRKARRQREIAPALRLAAPAQGITAPASTTNQSEHSPRRYDPTPPPGAARRGGGCLRRSRNTSTVRLSFATTTRPYPKRRWAVVSRHRGPKRKTNRPTAQRSRWRFIAFAPPLTASAPQLAVFELERQVFGCDYSTRQPQTGLD